MWTTYRDVQTNVQALARGVGFYNLANTSEGDGKKWNFVGIWSKNRREWLEVHLSNMYYARTTIGFFDSMGPQSTDDIITQTELTSVFASSENIDKMLAMKSKGLAQSISTIISFDQISQKTLQKCEELGVRLLDFKTIVEAGKNLQTPF